MLLPTSLFHLSDAFLGLNDDGDDLEMGSLQQVGRGLNRKKIFCSLPLPRKTCYTTRHDGRNDTDESTQPSQSTFLNDPSRPQADMNAKPFSSSPTSLWSKAKALIFPHLPLSQAAAYRVLPIFSGIFIPFSVLLEIPSLIGHWYIRTVDNKTIEIRPNPQAMDIAMGFSMVCAVLATVCLLIRFAERGVKRMTLICIAFLTIHDIINIVTVIVFGVVHRFDDGFTFGQSFWMTTCSTIASFTTNITLLLDYIWTSDFEKKGSGLTRKQRSLAIVVILLLCFIAFGAFVHTKLIHLDFIDALYFTVASIESIGFGDITPPTAGARVFTCSYAAIGILNLVLAVGLIRDALLEAVQVGLHKRLQAARAHERARRAQERWKQAIKWRLESSGQPLWVKAEKQSKSERENQIGLVRWGKQLVWHLGAVCRWCITPSKTIERRSVYHRKRHRDPPGMRLNVYILTQAQLEAAALEAGVPLAQLLPPRVKLPRVHTVLSTDTRTTDSRQAAKNLTHARLGRMMAFARRAAFAVALGIIPEEGPPGIPFFSGGTLTIEPEVEGSIAVAEEDKELADVDQVQEEFEELIDDEEKRVFYAHLTLAWMVFITFWMSGSVIFAKTEGWTFGTGMYFCFIAFSTLGYGDYSPKTPAGRSIFVVWALVGVGTLTMLIAIISEAYSARYKQVIRSEAFDEVVQGYHEEEARKETEKPSKGHRPAPLQTIPDNSAFEGVESPGAGPSSGGTTAVDSSTPMSDQKRKADDTVESLPGKVLQYTRRMRTLMEMAESSEDTIEQERRLKDFLSDLPGADNLSMKANSKVFQDPHARHALIALSLEKIITEITNLAEEAKESLET